MKHRIKAAAILIEDNKILLVKHVHPKTGHEWWVPPGGGMETIDENIFDCAIRETWEETGYNVKTNELLYIREFIDEENDAHNLEIYIKGEIVSGELTLKNIHGKGRDEHFIKEVRWIDRTEIQDITVFPEIINSDEFWDDIKSNNNPTKYIGKGSLYTP